MKQEERSRLARQRILDAAMHEFARAGYEGASLNVALRAAGISKGSVYHHFQDRDEVYLACAARCFGDLACCIAGIGPELQGSVQERLERYFDYRLGFFETHPDHAGMFLDALLPHPEPIASGIASARSPFDRANRMALAGVVGQTRLRDGLDADEVWQSLLDYIDFFNIAHARKAGGKEDAAELLRSREEACHRQIDMLLFGVLAR
jgi:TetR/AcrR family transcriptional regulator